jgi:ATPase subunit of ABC transporter with duplicated ATPase domains
LYALELEMLALADAMGSSESAHLDRQLRRFSDIQERLIVDGFYEIDVKAERIAAGLGLSELGLDTPVDSLSGGQRTKVLLAQLLLQQPQVLLLDEPTNYLDTAHVEWLTDYLSGYPHTFVVVSHDMEFLNQITTVVLHLEHQTITRYPGNLEAFNTAYELRKRQVHDAYSRQQEKIHKLETYIAKNKARSATARLAKSREKQLQKLERIDPPTGLPCPNFRFVTHVQPTSIVMETRDLVVGYDKPLFQPLNLKLKHGQKVAVTGFNGVGKTTLLKTVLGYVPAVAGKVQFGDRVFPSYFEQEPRGLGHVSAIENVWQDFPKLTQQEVRQALARSSLRGEKVFQSTNTMSGGEQAKVRLCKLMLNCGNWLVLDEPTNHLDAVAKDSLRQALMEYEGTVLLVTHEPEFYLGWVSDVWDAQLWRLV